jgi:hypothetical protein
MNKEEEIQKNVSKGGEHFSKVLKSFFSHDKNITKGALQLASKTLCITISTGNCFQNPD